MEILTANLPVQPKDLGNILAGVLTVELIEELGLLGQLLVDGLLQLRRNHFVVHGVVVAATAAAVGSVKAAGAEQQHEQRRWQRQQQSCNCVHFAILSLSLLLLLLLISQLVVCLRFCAIVVVVSLNSRSGATF